MTIRVLTDVPHRALVLLPADTQWSRYRIESLSAPDQALWTALQAGQELWSADISAPFPVGEWERVAVIGDATRSQYDQLRDAFEPESPFFDSVACLAMTGRGFHGRGDRGWVTLEGNLHLTASFALQVEAAKFRSGLLVLPALAAVDAVHRLSDGSVRPGVKWINDILIGGKKVAGVLTAVRTRGSRIDRVVFGIGMNVDKVPVVRPSPFAPAVGCLRDELAVGGPSFLRVFWTMLQTLSQRFSELIDRGPEPLLEAYRQSSVVIGRAVRIWDESLDEAEDPRRWPAPIARGVVRGIEPDLSLEIEGYLQPIGRGRLAFDEVCDHFGMAIGPESTSS